MSRPTSPTGPTHPAPSKPSQPPPPSKRCLVEVTDVGPTATYAQAGMRIAPRRPRTRGW